MPNPDHRSRRSVADSIAARGSTRSMRCRACRTMQLLVPVRRFLSGLRTSIRARKGAAYMGARPPPGDRQARGDRGVPGPGILKRRPACSRLCDECASVALVGQIPTRISAANWGICTRSDDQAGILKRVGSGGNARRVPARTRRRAGGEAFRAMGQAAGPGPAARELRDKCVGPQGRGDGAKAPARQPAAIERGRSCAVAPSALLPRSGRWSWSAAAAGCLGESRC